MKVCERNNLSVLVTLSDAEATILLRPAGMGGMLAKAKEAHPGMDHAIVMGKATTGPGWVCIAQFSAIEALSEAGAGHHVDEALLALIFASKPSAVPAPAAPAAA